MKKYLIFTFIIAFSASLSAQTMPSLNSSDAKKAGLEAVSKEKPNMEGQIKDALSKDEGLQKETINYLKNNPDTAKSVASMAKKSGGSNKGLMKSILGDKDLTSAAIEYISSNPELLSKAMKIIGM
ncbi:MAG: hypothetical protein ACI83B_000221 [Sediminicola sp.]|jgi:hypothetical protein